MTAELAEFGVIVRTILPGISATRIFTKIDRGDSIPDARRPAETVARISPFYAAELPYP
jgi:NAD(P)-dependent dehydrogenase (short-subunit alcohol dehydrogenase family)